jgi:hypothetical protein
MVEVPAQLDVDLRVVRHLHGKAGAHALPQIGLVRLARGGTGDGGVTAAVGRRFGALGVTAAGGGTGGKQEKYHGCRQQPAHPGRVLK